MTNINLLPEEERAQVSFEGLKQKLSVASVAVLAVAAVLTLGTLIFFTILGRARAGLVLRIEDNSAQINDLKVIEDLVVVVKGKTTLASKITDKGTNVTDIFNKVAEIVPQGVYFTDIKLLTEKVALNGKAKTSSDMAGLISSLTGSKGVEVLEGVTVDALSSDEKGQYTFAISAKLVGKGGAGETTQ